MLFDSSKPVAFYPSGRRPRSGLRLPRWLTLLLVGAALGAAGVIFVQQRYLPPRISVQEGEQLRNTLRDSEAARAQQASALAETSRRLEEMQRSRDGLALQVSNGRAANDHLQEDLKAIVSSLPPDPRAGAVEIRAGRFVAAGGALNYSVVLTHGRSEAPMAASMQFVVAGDSARGTASTMTSPLQPVSVGPGQIQRGTLALPEGLQPREVTVRVVERGGGRALGMRVLKVN